MQLDLTGKVALVTGGTRGIGHDICRAFVDAGAKVALCSRDGAAAEQTASALGEGTRGYVCDVGVSNQVEAFAKAVEKDVDLTEVLLDRLGKRFDLVAHADVADVAPRPLAQGARRLLRRRAVAGAERDLGSRVDEGAANVVSDPARAAGDECDLPRQIELHPIPALLPGVYYRPSSCGHIVTLLP